MLFAVAVSAVVAGTLAFEEGVPHPTSPAPPGPTLPPPTNSSQNNTTSPPPPPPSGNFFNITFGVTGGGQVQMLLNNLSAYILPGDAFDLVAGNNGNLQSSVKNIDRWSSDLLTAFPNSTVYVHTSGITSYSELAPDMNSNITGMSYDYEPGYEPEFTYNFTKTVANFADVASIASSNGLESVGYPTGIPLLSVYLDEYDWNYATLGRTVDQLFIQTQMFCQFSPQDYARAVGVVLAQYSAAGITETPYFQITIGNSTSTLPHAVTAPTAYACAQQLEDLGVHTLYIWWDGGGLSNLEQFLSDIGRN